MDVHTQLDERANATRPRRAPRRARSLPETPAWRREQDRMVAQIADHALVGGVDRAGPGASDEQIIDAYLEVLKHDLLALARRDG